MIELLVVSLAAFHAVRFHRLIELALRLDVFFRLFGPSLKARVDVSCLGSLLRPGIRRSLSLSPQAPAIHPDGNLPTPPTSSSVCLESRT
jgi:hypothetical protein